MITDRQFLLCKRHEVGPSNLQHGITDILGTALLFCCQNTPPAARPSAVERRWGATTTGKHLPVSTWDAFQDWLGACFRGILWSPVREGQWLGACGAAQARSSTTQGACCLYKTANKAGYHPGSSCIRCQWPCGGLSKTMYVCAGFAAQGEECKVGTQQSGFVGPLPDI